MLSTFTTIITLVSAADLDVVKAAILYLHPQAEQSDAIASSLLKYSAIYSVDWQITAAILARESSFQRDPQNCLIFKNDKQHCKDLGIAQINYRVWHKELLLNKAWLLKDMDYNIETMYKILFRLKGKYGKEKHWFTRYHSSTKKHRLVYQDLIDNNYLRINSFVEGYRKGYYESK